MDITKDDMAIVQQALQSALANSTDYQEISMYEQVLGKISGKQNKQQDGFRYDYGDSSS